MCVHVTRTSKNINRYIVVFFQHHSGVFRPSINQQYNQTQTAPHLEAIDTIFWPQMSESNKSPRNSGSSRSTSLKPGSAAAQLIEKKIIFNENTPQARFNQGLLWPPIIKLPENEWIFNVFDVLSNLEVNKETKKTKSFIKYCVEFLYNCKRDLNLQDHTFTCMTLFFYRYWMLEGSEALINLDMDKLCLLLLVIVITACKTMENHRKVNQYVEVVVARGNPTVKSMTVLDKKKWKLRENLLNDEMQFLAKVKFDLNVINPKTVLDDFYGFYSKYNVDNSDLLMKEDAKFKSQFSAIIKECKAFITNCHTQPMSLICDGYDFVQYALVFCAFNYNKMNKAQPGDDSFFKFSPNFFKRKFERVLTAREIIYIAECQFVLERNFLNNKTNKGVILLELTEEVFQTLLDQSDIEAGHWRVKNDEEATVVSSLDPSDQKIIKKQKLEKSKGELAFPAEDLKQESDKTNNDTNDKATSDVVDDPYNNTLEKLKFSNIKFHSKPVESSNYYAQRIIEDVNPDYLRFIQKRINASYEQEAKYQQQQELMN